MSVQRQALQKREPQGRGLAGWQLLDQLLQRQLLLGLAGPQLGIRGSQLIEQARLAISAGIKAEVPQGALALLMQAMGNAHQPHPIAQVVLQGASDAAAQIGRWRLACPAAGSGADQGLAGLEGRTAEGLACRLLAAGGRSEGSHLGDGGEPHPQRPAAALRQGRPTQKGAWPDA